MNLFLWNIFSQALFPAPAFIDFPGRDRGREGGAERPPGYPGEAREERDRERIARHAGGGYVPLYRQAALPPEEETKPRIERLAGVDNVLMYRGDRGLPGLYISGDLNSQTPRLYCCYFPSMTFLVLQEFPSRRRSLTSR